MRTHLNMYTPAGDGENTRRGGFTLIEIMVVVAIIALLAGILMAVGSGVVRSASKNATKATLDSLDGAMSLYLKDHPEPGRDPLSPPNPPMSLLSNDWLIRLSASPDTAKLLEKLKPTGTGANKQILDGFGKAIYYLPSNLDMVATTAPTLPVFNTNLKTPGRFVSLGADGKPDSAALGATSAVSAGDDIYSNGASVAP